MHLFSDDICYWLAVTYVERAGPLHIRRWLEHFGNIKNLFSASLADLQSVGLSQKQIESIKNPDWSRVEREVATCEKEKCHLITCVNENYPFLLKELVDAPILLYVKGEFDLLSKPQIAIVGSRNPSVTGRELAEQFADSLSRAGLIVTSGLAMGIDAASHHGALNAKGKTIAVMGSGLQYIYPASNRGLAKDVIEQGALVSEFPLDMPPRAPHFPMRNRVISGLSLGVLVVEAALRSGSLITARFAVEQGREVFALPGSIHNPLARGCHQLIRQGAKLIETADDILVELGALKEVILKHENPTKKAELTENYKNLLDKIGYEATSLDAIIIRSGLTADQVSSMLLALELKGYVSVGPGGYIRNF